MQGKILDYNIEYKSGLIRGTDDKKYSFRIEDCKSSTKPRSGAEVDFEPHEDKAKEIYILTKDLIDDIKETASTALDATTSTAQGYTNKAKKIIPYIFGVILIVILVDVYDWYKDKREQEQFVQERSLIAKNIKDDAQKANLFFTNKQHEKALSLYLNLNDRLSDYNEKYIISTPDKDIETENMFLLRIAECLVELKNPIRAKSILEKMDISDSYIDQFGREINRHIEKDKAKYYILKAKINALNNEYDDKYSYISRDYYSANAQEACKYGDCSLVEK